MSWFGFGGDKKPTDSGISSSSTEDFSSASFINEAPTQFAAPSSAGSFEEQVMLEQQKMVMQTVLLKLTEVSFENCISKPSSSMSSSEASCISATVAKYIDTSEIILKRFGGSQ